MQEREIQAIVDQVTKGPEAEAKFKNGSLVRTKRTGTAYRLENIHDTPYGKQATIRRAVPKVKGKAARKAARVARRQQVFAR